jgi:hypothetical protein
MHGICTVSEHMTTTWVSVVWFIFTTFVPAFGIYLFMLAMFLSDPRHGPTMNTNTNTLLDVEPKNEEIYGYYDPNCDHSTSSCEDNSSNSDIFEESDGCEGVDNDVAERVGVISQLSLSDIFEESDGCEGVDNDVVETEPSDKKIQ